MTTSTINRRRFLTGAAAGTATWLILRDACSVASYQANDKLNIALVGIGNRGRYHADAIPRTGQNLVAVCDADQRRVMEAVRRHPEAAQYGDFRKMLDEMDRRIDALVVATPEHTHAAIAAAAMKRGKHVYVEKPIAHDVAEARALRQIARQRKVATQMGNQGMATDSFRRTLERIQDGAVGEIREAHVWYVFGGSGPRERPADTPQVPDYIDWDVWLGPAPFRPFHPSYLTGWGAWRDFSTGCLGGGGSHSVNLTFKALNLAALWEGGEVKGTIRVEAETPGPCPENFPLWQMLRFDVPARGPLPPARIHWYNAPEPELKRLGVWAKLEQIAGRPLEWQDNSWTPRSGSLLVGSKGVVHTNAHNSVCALLPEKDFPNTGGPPRRLPRAGSHEREWQQACKGGSTPLSNFDHSGPAMELLLLGNVATLVGRPVVFDPLACRMVNDDEADRALRPPRRDGWPME
jgi:hypothetical protein